MSPDGARIRLFVALDLPGSARAALAAFRDAAADPAVWRPVPDAALHVTLAFLGHRPAEDAEAAAAVLRGLGERSPVPLRLGAPLGLPPRRPRVLTVALEDAEDALARLQSEVSAGLAAAGVYVPEARAFRPHVTVGRLRAGARAPGRVDAAPDRLAFAAHAVTLYRSHLARAGASYEALFTREL